MASFHRVTYHVLPIAATAYAVTTQLFRFCMIRVMATIHISISKIR
jgi:hypothetical protein